MFLTGNTFVDSIFIGELCLVGALFFTMFLGIFFE